MFPVCITDTEIGRRCLPVFEKMFLIRRPIGVDNDVKSHCANVWTPEREVRFSMQVTRANKKKCGNVLSVTVNSLSLWYLTTALIDSGLNGICCCSTLLWTSYGIRSINLVNCSFGAELNFLYNIPQYHQQVTAPFFYDKGNFALRSSDIKIRVLTRISKQCYMISREEYLN